MATFGRLAVATNVPALTAQTNLRRSTGRLNTSLERLSTGFQINRSADNPSGLVISEFQRAQISGLGKAIDNVDRAVSLVQTAEGGLAEINALLIRIRELAVDSANNGALDADSLAANQANVENLLNTVDRIAGNTRFGTFNLLDGSSGLTGTTNDKDVSFLTATDSSISAATNSAPLEVDITRPGQRAFVDARTQLGPAGTLAQEEILTVNGVQITLDQGLTQQQVIDEVNKVSNETGARAGVHTVNEVQEITITGAAAGTINITGIADGTGGTFAANNIDVNNVATTATSIQDVIDAAIGVGNDNNVQVLSISKEGNILRSIVLQYAVDNGGTNVAQATVTQPTTSGVSAINTLTEGGDKLRIFTEEFGSNAEVTVVSNTAGATGTSTGFGTTVLTDKGVDVAGTLAGQAATGVGNVLKGDVGTRSSGVAVEIGLTSAEGNGLVDESNVTFETTRVDINERQSLTVNTAATGGTFTLSFDGETTVALAFNTSISDIQRAIEDLSTVGANNISVTGTAANDAGLDALNTITLEFQNHLSGTAVNEVTLDLATLTPAGAAGVDVNGVTSDDPFPATPRAVAAVEIRAAVAAVDSNLTTVGETGGKLFGATAATTDDSLQGNVTLSNNSRNFQIGAFANDDASVTLNRSDTTALGIGTAGQQYSNLSELDIRTNSGANDAIIITDAAIRDVANLRGTIGAFQQNILQVTQSNLRTQLVNLQSAESVLRDTDFTSEITNFTNEQIRQQASTSVLALANQTATSILGLLQGASR